MTEVINLRNSDRREFRTCRMRWDFSSKMRMGYEPAKTPVALGFGTAFHKGLETWYTPALWHERRTGKLDNDDCIEAFTKSWWDVADKNEELAQELRELGVGMLYNYFDYSLDNDDFEVLFTELHWELPLCVIGEITVVAEGTIDLVVRDRDGFIWVFDHKTASQFGDTEFLDKDTQITTYCWALSHFLPVHGFMYNEVKKKAPKPPKLLKSGSLSKDKRQSTTYDMYLAAIDERGQNPDDYRDILRHLQLEGETFFRRTTIHRSERELQQTRQYMVSEAMDMILDPRIYPNPTQQNCQGCAFKGPCQARLDGLEAEFVLEETGMYGKRG